MTPAANILRARIEVQGPISFSEFMDCALYHPQHGYYRRPDVFGKSGDFYTAEQLQPVFGRCIASDLADQCPPGTPLIELGAGRCDMAPHFSQFHYHPVDIASSTLPESFTGIVFSNEFFDALPVDVFANEVERRVNYVNDAFVWTNTDQTPVVETQNTRLDWIRKIDSHLRSGIVYTIDYGYTESERPRFPQGTLMSYRKHIAYGDVLRDPGLQDITAHVNFSALQAEGERLGWRTLSFETLSQTLLRIGQKDHFADALQADDAVTQARLNLQLKTLLFGMGETFRVLVQRKTAPLERSRERNLSGWIP